ncbi:hypothetical protein [Nocardia sp. NPDC005366]|uniref:hypothetical protein n=1 Tax=Nocardia sp. NPDC005366 TaxID=3156878 RepID=UPI0033AEC6DD
MGAYSTTSLRSAAEADEAQVPASVRRGESNPPVRAVSTVLLRVSAWLFFVGGIIGAVLGIAGLHVEITVVGLILACTAGLVLLKLRADTRKSGESD